ncbi:uncharacterized protein LY79DRAFT_674977 [Colletotrichum navitas]|uniref:Uncharacterized protein n=1 Tax=Colletotrichum navitas TaxID=681940 RepID=A0AAD8PKA9_9PEZI|nr:uncharacterized protein LY79DRAFT_674977 [Colletotrichum navitas]KAK1566064.1 hypothetical protein LY79DRAFT_674977 [Colletotrichum navitas]
MACKKAAKRGSREQELGKNPVGPSAVMMIRLHGTAIPGRYRFHGEPSSAGRTTG